MSKTPSIFRATMGSICSCGVPSLSPLPGLWGTCRCQQSLQTCQNFNFDHLTNARPECTASETSPSLPAIRAIAFCTLPQWSSRAHAVCPLTDEWNTLKVLARAGSRAARSTFGKHGLHTLVRKNYIFSMQARKSSRSVSLLDSSGFYRRSVGFR